MRVLVTGANGHLGANLVRDLLGHDYDVVPMVREGADLRGLHGLDLAFRTGDILDAKAVRAAMDGVDAVFHLAQPYKTDPSISMDEMVKPGVEGTKHVYAAMKDAGVKRIVYTASVACCGIADAPDRPLDESARLESSKIPYSQAKIMGEKTAMALAEEHGIDTIVTLPGGNVGPWDFKGTPSHEPLWDAANGKGPAAWAISLTDTADIAAGHRLALEKGTPGERYILANDVLDIPDIATGIEALCGTRPATSLPPKFVLKVAITVLGLFGKAPLSHEALEYVHGKHFAYDTSKARDALGYAPKPPSEALTLALRWGALLGRLKPEIAARVEAQHPHETEWVEARDAR